MSDYGDLLYASLCDYSWSPDYYDNFFHLDCTHQSGYVYCWSWHGDLVLVVLHNEGQYSNDLLHTLSLKHFVGFGQAGLRQSTESTEVPHYHLLFHVDELEWVQDVE